jgi:hypothetical protein
MKVMKLNGAALLIGLAALLMDAHALPVATANGDAFLPYQVILDRRVFGTVQRVAAATPQNQAAPQGSFILGLRMCAITETGEDGDLRVGIVDVKQNKSYLFRIGDAQDEITLVDADFEEESALLSKGGESYWVFMREGAQASAQPGAASMPASNELRSRAAESYVQRLRKRREAVRERRIEAPRMDGEQLQEHLKQYQMELIRAGGDKGPPLPMELTPEMDAQLVEEGVLPPPE